MTSSHGPAGTGIKSGDLGKRVASALVMIPVAIAEVWIGGPIFAVFVVAIGVIMCWEWARLVHDGSLGVDFYWSVVAVILTGAFIEAGRADYALGAIAAVWLLAVATAVYRKAQVFWAVIGIPYVTLPIAALIAFRADPEFGLAGVIWVFAVVWSTDIFAYFAGRGIGGPKLAPRASPNKTWAGLFGGMAGAAAAGAITAYVIGGGSILGLAIFSGCLAVGGQIGDIGESAMKRHFGVKDSSNLIPGHGGVMDRLDGLVVVAVIAWAIGSLKLDTGHAAQGALIW